MNKDLKSVIVIIFVLLLVINTTLFINARMENTNKMLAMEKCLANNVELAKINPETRVTNFCRL